MTEAEWLVCTDPTAMVKHLRSVRKLSDRKARLIAVACCRRIWRQMGDERSRQAVETAERFADGTVRPKAIRQAYKAAAEADKDILAAIPPELENTLLCEIPAVCASTAAYCAATPSISAKRLLGLMEIAVDAITGRRAKSAERSMQSLLLRDVFGNPFRHVSLKTRLRKWNDGAVTKTALAMYDERRFSDMPILADALEDAGADNDDILTHCREPGPHVRGCWVIDLILGKK